DKEIKFFKDLTQDEKTILKSGTFEKSFEKGEIIHNSYEPCTGVIVVRKGKLRVYMLSELGKEITLYYLEEGEMCILSASCVLATISFEVHVEAETKVEILQISASVFNQIIKSNIKVENYALRLATVRFSDVMWAMQQILFFSMDKRLAMYLYEASVKANSDVICATHEEIAKSLGSAREVITRLLNQFANEGLVELTRGKVTVTNRSRLTSIFS
ncbi:MAG TPA: Crp/Fnr family transcriptional regulator, partial [Clostridia bacterium]|nr:Crp/Fnr family transcriptional regulator [Clostridia bacterium]